MLRIDIVGYVQSDETAKILEDSKSDITFSRSKMAIRNGNIEDAIDYYSNGRDTPDFLIVEISATEKEEIFNQIDGLANCVSSQTKVMILGKVNDVDLYRDLKEMGIADYMCLPITTDSFINCVRDIYGEGVINDRGHIIAVYGAKGGVGASSVAHNLASKMAEVYKKPITLIDMDVFFGSVGINYNEDIKFGFRDALDIKANKGELDQGKMAQVLYNKDDNLWLLASNPHLDPAPYMTIDNVSYIIEQIALISEYVILDIPHVWNDVFNDVMINANDVVIVTDPSLAGLRNAQNINEAIGSQKPKGSHMHYVINMMGVDKSSDLSESEFTDGMKQKPAVVINWLPNMFRHSGLDGVVLTEQKGHKNIHKIFRTLSLVFQNNKNRVRVTEKENKLIAFLKKVFTKPD